MSNRIAVSIVPGEMRLMVARANGSVRPIHQLSAALPDGAVMAGLQGPNLPDPANVAEVLGGLAKEAEIANTRIGSASLLIPDAAVRMALVPIDGSEPRHAEGMSMAEWALRDLLPVEPPDARVDWSIIKVPGDGTDRKWLLAIGADARVVGEYESVMSEVGWNAGRVVPLTLALSCGADVAEEAEESDATRLVLSGAGGQLACMVEADGVPRFHRAWRSAAPDLDHELAGVGRYVSQRLDLTISEAVLAGPEMWRDDAATACAALGWRVRVESSWAAHLGAIEP